MRTITALLLIALTNCMGAVATAITLGADAYASYSEFARATSPPEKIYPVPKRGARTHRLVYADDPRIPYWCSEPAMRSRIAVHCDEQAEAPQP